MKITHLAATMIFLLTFPAENAKALILPDSLLIVSGSLQVNGNNQYYDYHTVKNNAENTVHEGGLTTNVTGYPPALSSLSVAKTGSGDTSVDVRSGLNLSYSFYIAALSKMTVPLHIKSYLEVVTTGNSIGYSYANAELHIGSGLLDVEVSLNKSDSFRLGKKEADVDKTIDVFTNTFYSVNMVAVADAEARFDAAYSSSLAFVDPTFSIPSSFPNADSYTFLFSPGIGNAIVPSVPLPASAPMFGAALLTLGLAGYGVKRKRAPVVA